VSLDRLDRAIVLHVLHVLGRQAMDQRPAQERFQRLLLA
jgi:hypothetical protein